eukprot:TRINITY_DN21413_c0_g2_i2.p1 TRINITY_DN21413_c0_g2~~TRINITY_DN21413_c0_g2_i2.p1  ORF type:complete len:1439 (-),score=339.43 TRINITY_DN21413_c0_g2_i2:128-4444(-)
MNASLFSQPPVASFRPLPSDGDTSLFSCGTAPSCRNPYTGGSSQAGSGCGAPTEFETISSKVCDWAGELRKDHDLRQGAAHNCAWLFSEQSAPFEVSPELPSSDLIPAAQRQSRVDFVSSAAAMKSLFRAASACEHEADVGVVVHRLGDWLVVDDGAELSASLGFAAVGGISGDVSAHAYAKQAEARPPPCRAAAEETLRQRRLSASIAHQTALERAAEARRRAEDAQRHLEEMRELLWQAEVAAKRAQEELRERAAEVARTAHECENANAQELAGDLYRNFLGHSIRMEWEDHACDACLETTEQARHCASSEPPTPKLLALHKSSPFRQVGVWKVADDASVVVGSKMICLGNAEHPKLTLYLHDSSVVSDMVLLEHWLECVIAGVPEFAICFHRDGAVQSYTLYKVAELWPHLEERLAIESKLQMMLEVLRWMKRQCCFEGCTYWLSKAKNEPTIKLFKLCGGQAARRGCSTKALEAGKAAPQRCDVGKRKDLVCKNTFLEVLESVPQDSDSDDAYFRRAKSCPARMGGCAGGDALSSEEEVVTAASGAAPPNGRVGGCSELSLRCHDPFRVKARGRIAALFFRRAVSSLPGVDVVRFFQYALDLARQGDGVVRSLGESSGLSMPFLQVGSHLGLALCHLECCSGEANKVLRASRDGGRRDDGGAEDATACLLAALREDSPLTGTCEAGRRAYRLRPMCGRVRRAPLHVIAISPWPHALHSETALPTKMQMGEQADEEESQTEEDSTCHHKASSSTAAPPVYLATQRVADALDLLRRVVGPGEEDLPDCGRDHVEALAYAIAAMTLLRLAGSLVHEGNLLQRRGMPAAGTMILDNIALKALELARSFAALDATQRVAETWPFFALLPDAEELLFRIEYLTGGILFFRHASFDATSTLRDMDALALGSEPRLARVRAALAQMEGWLQANAVSVGTAAAATASPGRHRRPFSGSSSEGGERRRLPLWKCRRQDALVHYEKSIRLLPESMRQGRLLHHLTLALASATLDVAADSLESADAAAAAGSCDRCLEQILECESQIARACDLADAAGQGAVSAVAEASRAQLLSLAADALASRASSSGDGGEEETISRREAHLAAELMRRLSDDLEDYASSCDSEAAFGAEDDNTPLDLSRGLWLGRLGDAATQLALQASRQLDPVVEPDASAALAALCAGSIQAAAARLLTCPPPDLDEVGCRAAVTSLLAESLQCLQVPVSTSFASAEADAAPSTAISGLPSRVAVAQLQAHADLMISEQADNNSALQTAQARAHKNSGSLLGQRQSHSLERARAKLHGSCDAGRATRVLLLHLHLSRAGLHVQRAALCGGTGGASRLKQQEAALEELLAASGVVGSAEAAEADERLVWPCLRLALLEARHGLLQRLQGLFRELCATTAGMRDSRICWKDVYRAFLKLPPESVGDSPAIYHAASRSSPGAASC